MRIQILVILFIIIISAFSLYPELALAETAKNHSDDLVVILGASYAKGWNPEKLGNMVVVNKGINGNQSFEMLARFERDVLMIKPKAVIIWGFINDIFRSGGEDINKTIKKTKHNITNMMEEARQNNIIPVLATEVTITGPDTWSERISAIVGWALGKKSYQDYINQYVTEVNKWIRDTADKEDLILLDLESVMADKKGVRKRKYAAPDGSHISMEGYESINIYASEILGEFFRHK